MQGTRGWQPQSAGRSAATVCALWLISCLVARCSFVFWGLSSFLSLSTLRQEGLLEGDCYLWGISAPPPYPLVTFPAQWLSVRPVQELGLVIVDVLDFDDELGLRLHRPACALSRA